MSRSRKSFVWASLLLLCGSLFIAGCQRRSTAQGRLRAMDANLESLRQVPGRLEAPDGTGSPFTAYFQQMDLQVVEELPKEGGTVRNRYYYLDGSLFFYRQFDDTRLARQFSVDKKGKTWNAEPTPVTEEEVKLIAGRAEALKAAAVSRAGNMFVFPLMRVK